MFRRILIVCTGNICRSPMSEAILRHRFRQAGLGIEVQSAGVGALVGEPAAAPVLVRMKARGLDLEEHRARQLEPELARWADLILVMENRQREAVADIEPTARGKIYLYGQWIGPKEIPDPYKQPEEVYDQALSLIDEATESWMKRVV